MTYDLIYNGITLSSITSYTVRYPTISPSTYYRFRLKSKNCGQYSTGVQLYVASASLPSKISVAPTVVSYDSITSMTVQWTSPSINGGFPITSFKVYLDNAIFTTVIQSI